ncbi:MAG TPA: glycosyltransferase family 4 protein [Methylomirabilota bacterium]|nr:glycosyltransferase family 4 protein [Methylomirabilota bacterium]
MRLGLLPALGGGIRELARSGQATRLVDGYLRRYVEAFDQVVYFSYHPETLAEFTGEAHLLERVRMVAPARAVSRGWRALALAHAHWSELAACDVIRAFQITGVTPLRLAALVGRRPPPFVPTYGFAYEELSRSGPARVMKREVAAWGLREAAAVIATTDDLRARASRRARRVELIPNGVDTAHFVPGQRRRAAGETLRVLYVGRLSEEKNVAAAVEATASVGAMGGAPQPTSLTLVGRGPLEAALRAQTRRRGVADRVEFRGVIDQRVLPAEYAAADAFVLPSFTEGHPKALIEAMACGLACVASDCSGNRSLIQDGVTGLLFDARSPETLAVHLRRLATDPGLAARLGAAARERAVSRYDLGALVAREIALLRDVGRSGG